MWLSVSRQARYMHATFRIPSIMDSPIENRANTSTPASDNMSHMLRASVEFQKYSL